MKKLIQTFKKFLHIFSLFLAGLLTILVFLDTTQIKNDAGANPNRKNK
jgi:hypothetical protein